MKNSSIKNTAEKIIRNETTPLQEYFDAQSKLQAIIDNPISLNVLDFKHQTNEQSILNGIVYSLKDNIASKDVRTTGGSKFLENYVPAYDATVKQLLDEAGGICFSKDNLDEFGLGGNGLFSAYGIVKNPFDRNRIAGGSSSGSAVMVASNVVNFAIATDTGDSIRRPASLLGIYGFKPTYGRISRFGVYPYAPSLDHVGILSRSIYDISIIMNYIAKRDEKDMTSIDTNIDFINGLYHSKDFRLVVITEALEAMSDNEKVLFKKYLNELTIAGFHISFESFPIELLKLIDPIYKTISYAEATTCWANLTGILFGENLGGKSFDDIIMNNRSNLFGRQLKRRFVIGAYAISEKNYEAVFQNSKKIRTLIINHANDLFKNYDAIILPGSSRVAPLINDEIEHKQTTNICDDALQIANFGGFPSLTIPAIKIDHLYLGLNITCALNEDLKALNIGLSITGEKND